MGKIVRFAKNWRRHSHTLGWLAKHTRPFLRPLSLLLLLNILTSITGVGLSLVMKTITDKATLGMSMAGSVGLYLLFIFLSLGLTILLNVLNVLVNEKFSFGIRSRIYDGVLHTTYETIASYHSGDLVTRLSSDIDIVASGLSEVIPEILSLGFTLVFSFVAMAVFDFGLAVFVLLLGPIAAFISVFAGRKLQPLQSKVQQSESAYKSYLQETIANVVVLKAFDGQDNAVERLSQLRDERLRWLVKRQKIQSTSSGLLSGSFQLGYIFVIAWSAFRLSMGAISFGTMVLFLNLAPQVQAPLFSLSKMLPRLVSILASSKRIMEVETLPREDMTVTHENLHTAALKIQGLTFGYGDAPVISKLDLSLSAGEFVALTGDSGAGKTTLLRLIMAYYTPQEGSIHLLDEHGHGCEVTAGSRRYMSYVPQGNTLLSGTIADNLRMGRPDITEEEMWQLLSVVAADSFVRELPHGVNTRVGERGHGLSEGQAQRITIARALAKRAPLLILDEATSALDEKTERAVMQHLQTLVPRSTCIVVTHRSSVLPYCDRRVHIQDGKMTETRLAAGL